MNCRDAGWFPAAWFGLRNTNVWELEGTDDGNQIIEPACARTHCAPTAIRISMLGCAYHSSPTKVQAISRHQPKNR